MCGIACARELDKLFVDLDWGDQRACIEETGVGREDETEPSLHRVEKESQVTCHTQNVLNINMALL